MAQKICIIGPAHPYRGGLATLNARMAKAFAERGHDVTLFTFTLQYPAFLFPGKSQYTDEPAPGNLTIHRTINSVNPISWFRTAKKIRQLAPDLIIIRYWLPFMAPAFGTIAKYAKKNNHTRVIGFIDNIIPHESRPGDKLLSKYFVKQADGFLALSKQVIEDLSLFDQIKPRQFSPHPLYDEFGEALPQEKARLKLNLTPDGKYLLFFGFIREYKGLDLLLEAMTDARIREAGIKLLVAGEFYAQPDKYYEIVERLKLKDHIIFYSDYIPDHEIPVFFSAADVIVQPYKSATQSGVTQIAYQYDKPMIVTNVGGLPEIVPHGRAGFVVDKDPKQIANAIFPR